jgi:hypothetical protein
LAAQSSAEEVAFDQKRALNRLDVLCRTAEELDQISAAAGCEELIGKHRGMFADCTGLLSDLAAGKLTPEMTDKLADQMLKKALGENAPIAGINWRPATGEDLTFEEAKAIEAPGTRGNGPRWWCSKGPAATGVVPECLPIT